MTAGIKTDNPRIPFKPGATIRPKNKSIPSTKKAARLVSKYIGYQEQEYVVVITTNFNLDVIEIRIVGIGSIYEVAVNERDIMRGAILDGAYGIVIVHNHPSGNLKPSKGDKQIMKRISKAGEVLDIKVLDSIIVNKRNYLSVI